MAHPCFLCGDECYCSGSIDDVVVDKTPAGCLGCGCDDDEVIRLAFDYHDSDSADDDFAYRAADDPDYEGLVDPDDEAYDCNYDS